MTRFGVLAMLALAAGCAGMPAEEPPGHPLIALRNPGFEGPMRPGGKCPQGWECFFHAGTQSHRFVLDEREPRAGAKSVCIERVSDEPWVTLAQSLDVAQIAGMRVRFSIAVRADRIEGGDGVGPQVVVHGFQQNPLDFREKLTRSTGGWQRLSVEVDVPRNARMLEVGATLRGKGRPCLDEARLEVLSRSSPPV